MALAAFGLAFWVLAGVVLWATTVPLAMQSVPADVEVGLKKAILKGALQSVLYPGILLFVGGKAIAATRGTIGRNK